MSPNYFGAVPALAKSDDPLASYWASFFSRGSPYWIGNRKNWYRKPERESNRQRVDIQPGTQVWGTTTIARVGYWVEPKDMHPSARYDMALDLFKERVLRLSGQKAVDSNKAMIDQLITAIFAALGGADHQSEVDQCYPHGVRKALKWTRRQVGMRWLNVRKAEIRNQKLPWHDALDLCTIWYCQAPEPFSGTVMGWRECVTGAYYTAESSCDRWSGEYEYEPAGLSNRVQHRLYLVGTKYRELLCHPLDLEIVDNEADKVGFALQKMLS